MTSVRRRFGRVPDRLRNNIITGLDHTPEVFPGFTRTTGCSAPHRFVPGCSLFPVARWFVAVQRPFQVVAVATILAVCRRMMEGIITRGRVQLPALTQGASDAILCDAMRCYAMQIYGLVVRYKDCPACVWVGPRSCQTLARQCRRGIRRDSGPESGPLTVSGSALTWTRALGAFLEELLGRTTVRMMHAAPEIEDEELGSWSWRSGELGSLEQNGSSDERCTGSQSTGRGAQLSEMD
jgi:hypothetical protein